ncbi:hypothetical protein SCHPADRAFT_914901 [Schizopora paradoxa]|uniref:GDP/GTP exchange factor Sec2 N-terminal domain-containing protein n=1 Tax=Schizopora paradoxa TaxID=27342 RepID=A0A0H2RS04_9AGAM|nr:hypothetical protein SCHPADRAFT_914901 [Schizopora paradoxa]
MDDPQQMVIASLRSQISDLISQVTQLNGKLVKSYDRVSDLEDELHVASSNLRNQSVKVSQLELERTQHLAALDTGLLVEKAHVTSELTRLMEKATEEAAFRGEAENARANIEQDLDDLSASLFNQANTMVAEARFDKSLSEKKAADAEMALRTAEEVVSSLQQQMQLLRDERDRGSEDVERMRVLMEKGKFVVPHQPALTSSTTRLLSSHSPYQEFILFVTHLRSLRHATPQPPTISTFLTLPFLARIVNEDSDPTVRLDFAPSLNWLSRRSVLGAIQTGQLTVEPMSTSAFLMESTTTSTSLQAIIPGSHSGVNCALCGTPVIHSPSDSTTSLPQALARQGSNLMHSGTWSSSFFKNPLSSAAPSPPITPPPYQAHHLTAPPRSPTHPQHIYVFRVTQVANASASQQQQKPTNYPLCQGGWCLTRLRTTCSLWTFIRIGVVDHIWEEEVPPPAPPPVHPSLNGTSPGRGQDRASPLKEKAPPLPPRRRSKIPSMGTSIGSLGNFWGSLRSGQQSQSSSPSKRNSADSQEDVLGSVPMARAITIESATSSGSGSSSSVPPPLPRRSNERGHLLAPPLSNDNVSLASEYSHTLNEENYPMPLASEKSTATTNYMTPSTSESSDPHSDDGPSDAGEEFKTPVDELQSFPISRVASASNEMPAPPKTPPPHDPLSDPPLSPRSVPLPDSRPVSPAAKSRPTSMQVMVNHTLQLPTSRAASPSPIGTAPPPPLPRRAAARRPISQALGSLNSSPKDEKSALPSSTTGSTENSPLGEKAALPVTTTESTAEEKEESPIAELPEPSGDADEVTSTTTLGGDSPVDGAEDVTPVETKPTDEIVKHDEEKEEVKEKELPPVKEEKFVPLPPPRRRVGLPNGVSSKQDSEKTSQEDGDVNQYVGDATWEERTWKEITRLREDMFWARIGGVRN